MSRIRSRARHLGYTLFYLNRFTELLVNPMMLIWWPACKYH